MYWNFSGIVARPEEARFGKNSGRILVEIGFGNGEYLQHIAASRPDSLAVGIEVSQWCISKAARRALASGLKNVRILCGDARHLLKYAFEPSSIGEIFMNFPCPWPKRRHAERRVARGEFASLLASRLSPGGTFTLATDVEWYAKQTGEIFAGHGAFETKPAERNGAREIATKYERKWRGLGRDIYELKATLRDGAYQETKEADENQMDEIEITQKSGAGNFRERAAKLRGEVLEGNGFRAIFREVYFDGENDALVKIISADEGFEQHYYLRISEHGGRLRVTADSVGHPYRTPAVRASARYAAGKLT